ncbi:MAG: hypothetical protein CMF59_18655 [Leptospiraceae bacterium]|nr:hypothetical protein [Leptospiraceae bacterium]
MRRILYFVTILLFVSPLLAEAIYMRNGDILVGTITQQTEQSVTAIIEGRTRVIPKSQIARITFQTEEEIREIRRQQALERQRRLAAEKRRKEEAELERVRQKFLAEQAMARAERAQYLRQQVEKGNIEKPDEPISYYDFAWRSAVLPGWGHVEMGRPYIGYTYMGLTGLALLNVARTWGPAHAAQAENKAQVDTNLALAIILSTQGNVDTGLQIAYYADSAKRFSDEYNEKVSSYNYAVVSLMTLYGVQLAHIIFNGFAWEQGLVVDNSESPGGFRLDIVHGAHPGKLSTDTGLGLTPSAFSPSPGGRADAGLAAARKPETSLTLGYDFRF